MTESLGSDKLRLVYSGDAVDSSNAYQQLATGEQLYDICRSLTAIWGVEDLSVSGGLQTVPVAIGKTLLPHLINTYAYAVSWTNAEEQGGRIDINTLDSPSTAKQSYELWRSISYSAEAESPRVRRTAYEYAAMPGKNGEAVRISSNPNRPITNIAVTQDELTVVAGLLIQAMNNNSYPLPLYTSTVIKELELWTED